MHNLTRGLTALLSTESPPKESSVILVAPRLQRCRSATLICISVKLESECGHVGEFGEIGRPRPKAAEEGLEV